MAVDLWLNWDRIHEGPESTVSELVYAEGGKRIIFLLEDQARAVKVPGKTRIPAGLFEFKLRTDSPKFKKYYTDDWTKDWFKGMPWLVDIKGDGEGFEKMLFEYVYLHPGLDEKDSEGCGITGLEFQRKADGNYQVKPGTSRPAFKKVCTEVIYPVLLDTVPGRVFVTVSDARLK